MSTFTKRFCCFVMIVGSRYATAAISSHMYPPPPAAFDVYFVTYCAVGEFDAAIFFLRSAPNVVFTEMSTGVIVIFFHGALIAIRVASGSHHQLNSRRPLMRWLPPLSTLKPAPMRTSSFASRAIVGSSRSASATVVNGPPTQTV